MNQKIISILLSALFSMNAFADVVVKPVDYTSGGVQMEGMVAYDENRHGHYPAILIVHDWMGLSDFTIEKSKKLAKEGYVAFAVDIYGKGNRPKDQQEAAEYAKKFKDDRKLLRERMNAAYNAVVAMKNVNRNKILVIGYCFGGTAALELARSGAPLIGTVSFHGGLSSPTPEDAKNIKGSVLILRGGDDPFVPPAEVEAFKKEMQDANVDATFITYQGAVHAFTNPKAGNDNTKGAAYNAKADKDSWQAFESFLKEILAK
ncbi:MAG: dienelactone hydrolase family protein [Candidatus Berkiellales bacterium]